MLDNLRIVVQFPAGVRRFLFSKVIRLALVPTQTHNQWVLEALSPSIKQPGHKADHSPPFSAKVKTLPCAHTVHKGQLNLYFYPCINFKTHPIHYTGDNQTNKACSFLQKEQSLEKLHAPHVDHSALQELVYSCTLVTSIQLKCTGVLLINLQRAETLTTVIRPLKQDQTLIYCSQCSNETKYTYSHCLTNSNRSDIHLGCIFYIYYLSAWQELFPRMKNNQCRSSPL